MEKVKSQDDETDVSRRYKAPYTSHRPIPTIQQYEKEKEHRKTNSNQFVSPKGKSSRQEDGDAANRYLWDEDQVEQNKGASGNGPEEADGSETRPQSSGKSSSSTKDEQQVTEDTSEALGAGMSPKQRRKTLGKRKGERAEREVTDPVTHLPVRIHDLQSGDLKKVPENLAPPGCDSRTRTGLAGKSKTDDDLKTEAAEIQKHHRELENLFPTPELDAVKHQLSGIYSRGIVTGLTCMAIVAYLCFAMDHLFGDQDGWFHFVTGTGLTFGGMAAVVAVILAIRKWMETKINRIWEEELWHAQRRDAKEKNKDKDDEDSDTKESTHWLNNMLSSIWPLVNPDLFISLADTLEVSWF